VGTTLSLVDRDIVRRASYSGKPDGDRILAGSQTRRFEIVADIRRLQTSIQRLRRQVRALGETLPPNADLDFVPAP